MIEPNNQIFEETEAAFAEPRIFEKFVLTKLLGTGGSSRIYQATQPDTDRLVAIKILHYSYLSDQKMVDRFRREARAVAMLDHPNIVRIFAFGAAANGQIYQVMELIEGESLSSRLKRGPLSLEEFLRTFEQVCAGMSFAHSQGIVHRDLKPSNIMICSDGTIKIVDFGAALLGSFGENLFQTATRNIGTPLYMSPEQFVAKQLDWRTDIYSLGCVMYEALTTKLPFEGGDFEIMSKKVEGSFSPLSECGIKDIPVTVSETIEAALSVNPEMRPQSMNTLADGLRNRRSSLSPIKSKRSRMWMVACTFAAVAGIVALLMALSVPVELDRKIASTESDSLNVLYSDGYWTYRDGHFEEAEQKLLEIVRRLEGKPNRSDADTRILLKTLEHAAGIYGNYGRFDKAADMAQKLCDTIEQTKPALVESVFRTAHKDLLARAVLAKQLASAGQNERAKTVIFNALAKARKIEDEPLIPALMLRDYAKGLEEVGDFAEARKYYMEAQKFHSNNSRAYAQLSIEVIRCLIGEGKFSEAKTLFKQRRPLLLVWLDHHLAEDLQRAGQNATKSKEQAFAEEIYELLSEPTERNDLAGSGYVERAKFAAEKGDFDKVIALEKQYGELHDKNKLAERHANRFRSLLLLECSEACEKKGDPEAAKKCLFSAQYFLEHSHRIEGTWMVKANMWEKLSHRYAHFGLSQESAVAAAAAAKCEADRLR